MTMKMCKHLKEHAECHYGSTLNTRYIEVLRQEIGFVTRGSSLKAVVTSFVGTAVATVKNLAVSANLNRAVSF